MKNKRSALIMKKKRQTNKVEHLPSILFVEEKVLQVVKKAASLQAIPFEKLFNKERYGTTDVQDAADLVSRMLRWVPSDRISAKDAMMHPFLFGQEINIEVSENKEN